jgi:hypothetical protein
MNRLSASVLALLLVGPVMGAAQSSAPDTLALIKNRLELRVPPSWRVVDRDETDTGETVGLAIEPTEGPKVPDVAHTMIVVRLVTDDHTLTDAAAIASERLGVPEEKTLVHDEADGAQWRNLVLAWQDGAIAQRLVTRVGVVNGISVELHMRLPVGTGIDRSWLQARLDEFALICSSVRIDGKATFGKGIRFGDLGLRDAPN